MSPLLITFALIGAILLLGFGVLVRRTFWLPSIRGKVRYSEKYVRTQVPGFVVPVLAHIVVSDDVLVIAVPPLLFRLSNAPAMWAPLGIRLAGILTVDPTD